MIALLDARQAGLFSGKNVANNLIAGLIVGVVALPLAMAFAIASGVKPEQGLYTAILAGFIVSVFGGSRIQIAGPTGAFIAILAGITAKYGIDGLQIATLMAGVLLLALGIFRLGTVIKFIPDPVITGFTAGIGVIIFVGQWKDFLGLPPVSGEHFHEKLLHIMEALPLLHPATAIMGFASLLILILSPRLFKRIPAPLIAMVGVTLAQAIFNFDGIATIGSTFGGIPQTLPSFHVPEITASRLIELAGPAFAIAMLGAIESLLSAVVADGMAGTRHDSNQELIGQGLANIVAPLFGGFAATGAIARTATNVRNGGNSPLAGITHCAVLLLIILFLAPLAAYIPLCTLSAILFVVAWNMSEPHRFINMLKRAPRNDIAVLLITFFLTIFASLVVAVNAGVLMAALLFLRRMIQSVTIEHHDEERVKQEFGEQSEFRLPPGTMIYSIDGPFFFGAAETFERSMAAINEDPKILIFRLDHVPFIDMTGIQTLEDITLKFMQRNVRVIVCEANPQIYAKLHRAGFIQKIGASNVLSSLKEALRQSG